MIPPIERREIIRDSEPQLRNPSRFVGRVKADYRHCVELTRSLLGHNLQARYRQSLLGYVWLLITPLAAAGVWIFLHSAGIVVFANTPVPYPVHVVTGVFLWTGFVRMLNGPHQQLQASRHLLSKIRFPWEALVAAGWGEILVEIAIYLAVLAGVYLLYGISPAGILVAIPAIGALLVLGGALGLLATPLGMLYDDIPRAVGVGTFLLFFLTPVVYPVPTTMPGKLTLLANPVGILLVTSREVMTSTPLSHPILAVGTGIGAAVLLFAAWLLFRLSAPHLVSKL